MMDAKLKTDEIFLAPGLRLRPVQWSDLEAVTQLVYDVCEADGDTTVAVTSEEMKHEWETPGFQLERDAFLVETSDGRVVGFEEFGNTHKHALLHAALGPQRAAQAPELPRAGALAVLAHGAHLLQQALDLLSVLRLQHAQASLQSFKGDGQPLDVKAWRQHRQAGDEHMIAVGPPFHGIMPFLPLRLAASGHGRPPLHRAAGRETAAAGVARATR